MTKPLKPCYLPKTIPLPGKAAERTVAREMGLISGFFKKKTKSKGRPKNTMFMNSLPKKNKKSITPAASPANPVIDLTTNLCKCHGSVSFWQAMYLLYLSLSCTDGEKQKMQQ